MHVAFAGVHRKRVSKFYEREQNRGERNMIDRFRKVPGWVMSVSMKSLKIVTVSAGSSLQ